MVLPSQSRTKPATKSQIANCDTKGKVIRLPSKPSAARMVAIQKTIFVGEDNFIFFSFLSMNYYLYNFIMRKMLHRRIYLTRINS